MTDGPLLDLAGLRALAHPLRVRLLGLLRAHGPSTATALAARVGESSGSTSYHLRQLAAGGLVVEDPTLGTGRERWWRAAQDATRLDPAEFADDPEAAPAMHSYLSAVVAAYARHAQAFLDDPDWSRDWRHAAELSDFGLSLTPAELVELNKDVVALVESRRRSPRKGDETVVFQFQSFPRRTS